MSIKVCRFEMLACNGVASVQRCGDCGGVTIHAGPVSLRLDEAGLDAVSAVLSAAVARQRLPATTAFSATTPAGQA